MCPTECQTYDADKKDQCKWKYVLVKFEVGKEPSMIVKITKILLSLVVALSVTMILYNGLTYIVQT
ncbi:hypothetical protein J6T66_01620 [bacterium]|nr:hypothetical protein [bacterium]